MGLTSLQARNLTEQCLAYWQGVGMVERIQHADEITVTFVHKTFGEFAAARHLLSMPAEKQTQALAEIFYQDSWSEVVTFAGCLGLATPICAKILDSHATGTPGLRLIERALLLVGEADQPPGAPVRRRLFEWAFEYIRSERRNWAYTIGDALVPLAERFPGEIGPLAVSLLRSEQTWSRVVGWACAVLSGPEYYGLEELQHELKSLPRVAEPGMITSLGGGLRLGGGNYAILQPFLVRAVREILERCPPELADELIPEIMNTQQAQTLGTYTKFSALFKEKGKNYPIKMTGAFERLASFGGEGYSAASRIAYNKTIGSIAKFGESGGKEFLSSANDLLHLSAFLRMTGFFQLPAYDVWAWTETYDEEAVDEVLRGVVAAAPAERDRLVREAQTFVDRIRSLTDDQLFQAYRWLPELDVPEIDWGRAKSLNLDLAKLERAVHNKSLWVVHMAGNLLEAAASPPVLEGIVKRLLATGRRLTLWAASALVSLLEPPLARKIICERAEQHLVPGCEHVFEMLRKLGPSSVASVLPALRNGLRKGNERTAMAAAELASIFAKPGEAELYDALASAYEHWVTHEEPYPTKGGVVPDSPREKILQALLSIREAEDDELFRYAKDVRSDVNSGGREALLKRLAVSDKARETLLSGVTMGTIAPTLLAAALIHKVPFDAMQVRRVVELLSASDPEVRFAAMNVLDEAYLPVDEIQTRSRARLDDTNLEIREAAFKLLEKAAGLELLS